MRDLNHSFFMHKALERARQALVEGEFPVGCVLVHDGAVVADGKRVGSRRLQPDELAHAEMAALRHLADLPVDIDRRDIALYCTLEPCMMCFGAIMLNCIGTIVYAYEDVMGGATTFPLSQLTPLYSHNPVKIIGEVLREESLTLFKSFFSRPDNAYWQSSLLARYTLKQPLGRQNSANFRYK